MSKLNSDHLFRTLLLMAISLAREDDNKAFISNRLTAMYDELYGDTE